MARVTVQGLVLAVEPDQHQAQVLARVIRQRVKADFVVVDSRDAAIAALSARVPDVILLTALLSPRDEDEMVAHLRTLPGADHVQTHTIPQLASDAPRPAEVAPSGGLLSKFRRKKGSAPIQGCDPALFADEVITFLARAAEMKAHAAPALITRAPRAEAPLAGLEAEPPAAQDLTDDASSWSSPFEWRRADAEAEGLEREGEEEVPRDGGNAARALQEMQAAAERESARMEAEAAADEQRLQLETEAAVEQERLQFEAEAAAERERQRLEAVAAAEQERQRLETVAAAERERVRLEAVAAAERERVRLEAVAAAEQERQRLEAVAAAEQERQRLAAEAETLKRQLAREAAERERLLIEAAATAERERVRLEAEAAAERERARTAAEAAERERRRLEVEAAAREEQHRLELAAERARAEAEAAAERERIRREAEDAERTRAAAVTARKLERKERAAAAARDRERLAAEAEAEARRQREAREQRIAAAAEEARRRDPFADFRTRADTSGPLLALMPVAGWARPDQPRPSLRPQAAMPLHSGAAATTEDELKEMMAGLALPVPVGAVGYARGCRIRRVRVPAAAEPTPPMPSPVIVSRRALAEMRTAR